MSKHRSTIRGFVFAATVTAALPAMATAGDLRDINVGMAISSVPDAGYINLTCVGEMTHRLADWAQWPNCPAGPDQLRGIRFEYDRETAREGTMVAGHPAILTVMINPDAKIAALTIETDPRARLYLRKKAFLLGLQARSRYGSEGWDCAERQPTSGEQPVGGVFVRETCKKAVEGRLLTVQRDLYRRPDQDPKNFVDQTQVKITMR